MPGSYSLNSMLKRAENRAARFGRPFDKEAKDAVMRQWCKYNDVPIPCGSTGSISGSTRLTTPPRSRTRSPLPVPPWRTLAPAGLTSKAPPPQPKAASSSSSEPVAAPVVDEDIDVFDDLDFRKWYQGVMGWHCHRLQARPAYPPYWSQEKIAEAHDFEIAALLRLGIVDRDL